MTDALRTIPVASGDTLSGIAAREGFTVSELLATNPQIRDPDVLVIGQPIKLPAPKAPRLPKPTRTPKQPTQRPRFELTVRFVNSWDVPPIGIRYELLAGKTVLAQSRILLDNEATFMVTDGTPITLRCQHIGEAALHDVGTFVAKKEHPVVTARINSFKLPSVTEPHPKAEREPAAKQPSSPATPAAPAKKDQGLPNQAAKNDKGAAEHRILPGECACGRDITIDELAAIYSARKKDFLKPFLEPLNSMMKTYKIDSCLRKAHALAQIGHESSLLKYRAEVLEKGVKESQVYDGYKGRGLMQITYEKNYAAYGKYKGVDFLGDNRSKLESVEYATDSAGWFWCYGKKVDLNKFADENDLYYITAKINGGFNGFNHRAELFASAHRVLKAPKCKTEANRSPTYRTFQNSRAFNDRDMAFGYGYWRDPLAPKQEGMTKNADESKIGYKRFLDLNAKNPIKDARYNLKKIDKMIKMAEERSQ